jgi:dephospho-CoA kinase
LLSPHTNLGSEVVCLVVDLLGEEVLSSDSLDRKKIADIVFRDLSLLRKLESLLHPYVWINIDQLYQKACEERESPLFVAEIPLLFEKGWGDAFDAVILVTAPLAQRAERFCHATGQGLDAFAQRSRLQIEESEARQRAHFILENRSSQHQLEKGAAALFELLTGKDHEARDSI